MLQQALDQLPSVKPRIISDRGSQFIAKDFKEFIRYVGLTHTFPSVDSPQSNGKIERFFQTAKSDCIRKTSFLSIDDARKQIKEYINNYNYMRLHSSIGYGTPFDRLIKRDKKIREPRERRFARARELRVQYNTDPTLFQEAILSNSR